MWSCDAHSKWPKVVVMKSVSMEAKINRLDDIFAKFGNPKQVVSDNGPHFVTEELEKYLENHAGTISPCGKQPGGEICPNLEVGLKGLTRAGLTRMVTEQVPHHVQEHTTQADPVYAGILNVQPPAENHI
ncbi:hypothetical protein chiPu_0013825 [Chiloscyllium punctatum]|uniref:Integrase catalytic domain-containing protein n=1 Tax=Chiloscyllium punctatum TaxID=137246 RepID=A0A401SY66_CHIPU|nr:hypothetical protein [Chiloscyllium punctatum]